MNSYVSVPVPEVYNASPPVFRKIDGGSLKITSSVNLILILNRSPAPYVPGVPPTPSSVPNNTSATRVGRGSVARTAVKLVAFACLS